MIVSIIIVSEAGDRFPYNFQDKSVEEIATILNKDMVNYSPMGEYDCTCFNETPEESKALSLLMTDISTKSENFYE